MPVAISRNISTTLTENGFITRDYPITREENDSNFSHETDSSEVDNDGEDDDDYSDDDDEEEDDDDLSEQETLLNHTRHPELFNEYFDHEPSVVNRDRVCNHQVTSRPCAYCVPSVSLRLANEVRIAYKALFTPKSIKFEYEPLDQTIVDGSFKSLKALHDVGYIKRILNEIVNLIVSIQNAPNYKINYVFNSALLRIHDRTESLLDDVRNSGKFEEYQIVYDFRNKLNAIGLIYGNCKENSSIQYSMLMDCQR